MSGGGKSVCKGRMGSSVVSDVDTKDLANNETKLKKVITVLLSTPMGVDYVVIGFNMEVQPFVTHNAV